MLLPDMACTHRHRQTDTPHTPPHHPGSSPLLPADVHTHGGRGCQDVCDEGQKPLQDQLQGGAARLDVAARAEGWIESNTQSAWLTETKRGRDGARGSMDLWSLAFQLWRGQQCGAATPHVPQPWGSFLWSTSTPPRCEAGVASPRAPLILALQKLLDLRQNRGAQIQFPQGAGERAKDTCSQHLALPTPPHLPSPIMATHAFWLTMLRRSTTTDRSLMATAESTDVCANRAPVSGDQGHSGPAWV